MLRLTTGLRQRVGRRGAALLTFAVLDMGIAGSLLDPLGRAQVERSPSYALLIHWVPLTLWAVVWLVVGATCTIQAFMRDDRFGYGLAIAIKAVWSVGMFGSWLFQDAVRGWVSGIVWGALGALVSVAAGWPEPPRDIT